MQVNEQAVEAAARALADAGVPHDVQSALIHGTRWGIGVAPGAMIKALTAAAPHMSGVKLGQLEPPQHSIGWLYHSDDAGTEFSENHPIESGECSDAKDIKPATAESLRNELLISWKTWAEDREELNRLRDAPSSAREQALEEAAGLCEMSAKVSQEQLDREQDRAVRAALRGEVVASNVLAKRIRALKSQPATEFGSKELVNSFNRGYVIACANIVNMYGAKVEVAEGFAQLSITKSDFEALELCSYDKDAIKTLEEFAGEEKLFVSSDHTPQTGGGE